jgi:Flp pilus assembly protein protease CpaA
MIYVVLSAGVFMVSALLIHRESRMLARIEAVRRARGLDVP